MERPKLGRRKFNMHYFVTFYFSSGKKMKFIYSEEKFKNMISSLHSAWGGCYIAGEEWGINFSQVTHYIVNKE
jgi:hypothetical protein